jgi:hypothetical protein
MNLTSRRSFVRATRLRFLLDLRSHAYGKTLTHKLTHRERFLQSFSATGSPR